MRRPALLAVDAGGSKVDAVLLRADGEVVGAARIRSSDHHGTGTANHLEIVAEAVRATCIDAGTDPERLPVAGLGVYCLAGADLPTDDRRIGRWMRSRGLTTEDIIRNDTFAVLRAGTERPWGVGVVCGYGTNCSAVAPDGRVFRFPAVGTISGDWGGGGDVGSAGLWYAIRAEDGRGERTVLRQLVPAHFGLRRPRQVVEAMHFGRLEDDLVVELAPVVFTAAKDGDRVARSIVDRQADEVVAMAGTAIKRLRMASLDVEVVLGGGIFRNDDERFFERIREGLQAVAPRAFIRVLEAPPVLGAALLGLDRRGATPAAHRRARAGLTHEHLTAHTLRGRKET
jgi:N-acetylglucosamine kinase-like BadF-type ATPase